jgi:hypothetical protein
MAQGGHAARFRSIREAIIATQGIPSPDFTQVYTADPTNSCQPSVFEPDSSHRLPSYERQQNCLPEYRSFWMVVDPETSSPGDWNVMPILTEVDQRKHGRLRLRSLLTVPTLLLLFLVWVVTQSWNQPLFLWFGQRYVLFMRLEQSSYQGLWTKPTVNVDGRLSVDLPGLFGGGSYEVRWSLN